MSWDLALHAGTGDLTNAVVYGDDEVLQRIYIRLSKELGEWFLNISSGLPWYQDGAGMLGAKPNRKPDVDLVLRNCVSNTPGVKTVENFKSTFIGRAYTCNFTIKLETETYNATFESSSEGFYLNFRR